MKSMEDLKVFLDQIRISPEFQAVALRAAKQSGFNTDTSDDSLNDVLNNHLTVVLGQIMFELSDERYQNCIHHKRKLYNKGCRGPLCRKSERDRSRNRYRQAHNITHPRRYNKRISTFDDQILEFIADKYDTHMRAHRETAA